MSAERQSELVESNCRLTDGNSTLDLSWQEGREKGSQFRLWVGGKSKVEFNPGKQYRGGGLQGLRHWKAELKETAEFSDSRCPVHLTKEKCNCTTANNPLPTLT